MNQEQEYTSYGSKADAIETRRFVEHVLESNFEAEKQGQEKTPLCIWGSHGIGKTELVRQIAAERNFQLAYIAPAQFEEMGDLVGMPTIEGNRTVFRSPEWVPVAEGPGIFLIDDVNRADDRILRGIMQLLQNYELISWKLPAGWQIVLTANPDDGDYSVTPMDSAMLTRMMHITMQFDPKAWAIWAEKNGVDSRGINFVLTYPEIVVGERTTPRSLVQFFQSIQNIPDLGKQLPLVQMLASSCLDEETVVSFIGFVQQNLSRLISPEAICGTEDFQKEVYESLKEIVDQEILRVDIIATICTRLSTFLQNRPGTIDPEEIKNIQAFLKIDFLPNDLRLTLLQDLVDSPNTCLKSVMTDPEISQMLLQQM